MTVFGGRGRPVVVGHRGAPVAAPANTPESFAAAAQAGATWVELDVRRSADRVLVVQHDAWTVDGVAVVDLPAAALRERGVWALADVLGGLPEALAVDVEVKNLPGEPDYDEDQAVVGLLAEHLAAVRRPLLASSFNPLTVVTLREALTGVPVALLTSQRMAAEASRPLAAELGAQGWFPHVDTPGLDEAAFAAARRAGLATMVWTVDDAERAQQFARAGVDALCTNDPATLAAALA